MDSGVMQAFVNITGVVRNSESRARRLPRQTRSMTSVLSPVFLRSEMEAITVLFAMRPVI